MLLCLPSTPFPNKLLLGEGLCTEIKTDIISKCTQQERTLPFVVALLSVDTGQLQMEGVCKASLTQPPLGSYHTGGKNHTGVLELACERTPFSGPLQAPLLELKKPSLVR